MPAAATDLLGALPEWLRLTISLGLVGWLIVSIGALLFRIVIPKPTHEAELRQERKAHAQAMKDAAERLAYVEARRVEERSGRIAAEKRVSDLTERWERALSLLGGIEKELIRVGRDDGRRGRSRSRDA